MVPLQSSAEAVPTATSPSVANTANSRRNRCAMTRSSRWPENDRLPSLLWSPLGTTRSNHRSSGKFWGGELLGMRRSKAPEDVTEDEQPSKHRGADEEREMRAHQNDEKQEGGDDSREKIDGMVILRQTAKKARDRDVIVDECVGFVDQGRRRDQYDYPD